MTRALLFVAVILTAAAAFAGQPLMRRLDNSPRAIGAWGAFVICALLAGCGGGGSDTPEPIGPAVHCERTASGTEICTEIDPTHVHIDTPDRSQAK